MLRAHFDPSRSPSAVVVFAAPGGRPLVMEKSFWILHFDPPIRHHLYGRPWIGRRPMDNTAAAAHPDRPCWRIIVRFCLAVILDYCSSSVTSSSTAERANVRRVSPNSAAFGAMVGGEPQHALLVSHSPACCAHPRRQDGPEFVGLPEASRPARTHPRGEHVLTGGVQQEIPGCSRRAATGRGFARFNTFIARSAAPANPRQWGFRAKKKNRGQLVCRSNSMGYSSVVDFEQRREQAEIAGTACWCCSPDTAPRASNTVGQQSGL